MYKIGQIVEFRVHETKKKFTLETAEIIALSSPNSEDGFQFFEVSSDDPRFPTMTRLFDCKDIVRIISEPLPLDIPSLSEGNTVLLNSGETVKISRLGNKYFKYYQEDTERSALISDIVRVVTRRGGSRPNAGRPPSGNPPKKRKALQLDYAIASTLPDLKMLNELIQEFRPIAESGSLRSQKLADFYKKLDSLPKILSESVC